MYIVKLLSYTEELKISLINIDIDTDPVIS